MRFTSWIRRHLHDTAANIPIMTALLLLPMTLMAGGSVDLVRHERIRVALQDALDRGTLAAASLAQTGDPKAVVDSYISAVPGIGAYELSVTSTDQLNQRKVTATASADYKTSFLHLAGMSDLTVGASSAAQDERKNVEISLVLDISGSMVDNGGMPQLAPAAKSFVDALIRPDTKSFTSMSVIPFAGQVNVGQEVFAYLAAEHYTRRKHEKSSCFEMNAEDFGAGIPLFPERDQVAHFTWTNLNKADRRPWWCPLESQSVSYITNDAAYLKSRLDRLEPYDGTGTAYGMKWAEMLLDPAMKPKMNALRTRGIVPIPAEFAARPAAFDDPDTRKYVVLFTDGAVGFQRRPFDWPTNKIINELTDRNLNGWKDPASGKKQYVELDNEAAAVKKYKAVCDDLKDKKKNVTIFTIAFNIAATPAGNQNYADLAYCASDPSYAYRIEGLNIATTFQSIATTIQKIRLVQ